MVPTNLISILKVFLNLEFWGAGEYTQSVQDKYNKLSVFIKILKNKELLLLQ